MATDARYGEEHYKQQRAPPEASLEVDWRAARVAPAAVRRQDAGYQQAAEERKEQAREAYVYLLRGKAPATDYRILRAVREEAEHIPAERQVKGEEGAGGAEHGECHLRQAAEYEGIENIRYIFK